MNFALAVEINRKELAPIVAGLVAMLGGFLVTVLPRSTHRMILDGLRPAESALRRLIAVLARDIVVPDRGDRAVPPVGVIPPGDDGQAPVFALFDPRRRVGPFEKRVPGRGPGVWGLDGERNLPSDPPAPHPDDPVDAARLSRRTQALQNALDDPEAQARRLARILAWKTSKWLRVMRPGRPPGYRARGRRPVDAVLAECQTLALLALHPPDT